jgi:hypothetical protein
VTAWTSAELAQIGDADELELAARRSDGTLRKPVTIWVVCDGDDLHVRSRRGRAGSWFRAAQASGAGHVNAGGVDNDVVFMDADDDVNDAYRTKYRRDADSYAQSVISPPARATTLKLVPHDQGSGS